MNSGRVCAPRSMGSTRCSACARNNSSCPAAPPALNKLLNEVLRASDAVASKAEGADITALAALQRRYNGRLRRLDTFQRRATGGAPAAAAATAAAPTGGSSAALERIANAVEGILDVLRYTVSLEALVCLLRLF